MKKNTSIIMIFTLILIAGMISCNNDEESNPWELPYFNQIIIEDNMSIHLMAGENQHVDVKGDGDLSKISLQVSNNVLTAKNGNSGEASNVVVEIYHPDVYRLDIKGNAKGYIKSAYTNKEKRLMIKATDAGEFYSEFAINVDSLQLDLYNAAKFKLDTINVGHLLVEAIDGTRCYVQGYAKNQNIEVQQSGMFNYGLSDFQSDFSYPVMGDSIVVEANNGARAWIYATKNLFARGNSGAFVYYKEFNNLVKDIDGNVEVKNDK